MKIYHSLCHRLNQTKLPIIVVEIEDKHLCFILDTGSTCSLIDSNVVEYFKVDVVILPFNFEGYTYKPKFCVQPLADAFKSIEIESGVQIHGLLGTDFLIENKWIINFKELNIYINNE